MTLLAIDTTSEFGSLALVDGDRILEEVEVHSPEGFSPVIFGEIEALLTRHRLTLPDIDGFAAASGPGSFTGVRVGLAAVKGLAEALGKSVVGVSNLQALAVFGTQALRAVVLDARRGQIYGAVYDSQLKLVQDEIVQDFAQWMSGLPEGVEIVTSGYAVSGAVEAPRALAGAVGRIAAARFLAGEGRVPEEVDANYVRRSDAELFWREA